MRVLVALFMGSDLHDERGATATEYAILVGFMVFAVVAGATLFGVGLNQAFTNLANVFETIDDHF